MEEEFNNEWKTVSVHKDTYNIMKEKQKELIKEKGKHVQLSYVAEYAILEGIDKVKNEEIRPEYIKKLEKIIETKGDVFKNKDEFIKEFKEEHENNKEKE